MPKLTYIFEFEGQPELATRFEKSLESCALEISNYERESEYIVFDASSRIFDWLDRFELSLGDAFTVEIRPAGLEWEDAYEQGVIEKFSYPIEGWA